MGIIGADVDAAIAHHFLKPDPDVGLQIFHEMADMNRAICVGKS
jgi:hypothetical protein